MIETDYHIGNVHVIFTAGDVVKVLVAVRKAIISMVEMPPNALIIREACASSSDYFTLYERVPKIYASKDNLMPNWDLIKGKIEFRNFKFTYPDDKGQKPVLNGLNMTTIILLKISSPNKTLFYYYKISL